MTLDSKNVYKSTYKSLIKEVITSTTNVEFAIIRHVV